MSPKKLTESPISEKDQLLDQLNALDKDNPNYNQNKDAINKKLKQIANNPNEIIDALNPLAEKKLSPADQYHADRKHQKIEDRLAVDQLLEEINNMGPENIKNPVIENDESLEVGLATYFHQLSKTADIVKKAINSFNWRSFKQISRTEKDQLCIQIEKIVINTKTNVTRLYREQADSLTISRLINEARYQIQKIADDRHIKIPEEY